MVTLHTIDGGTVDAINDALLYDFIIGQNGIATGATVTSEGALLLHIDSGWGVIKGRIFSIEAETVSATPSTSGTVKGRLILQIDITNTTNPIAFVTQAAATLPALQQEDINGNGTIFQLPIATYDVNEVAVLNLQMVAPVVEAVKQQIDSVQRAASTAQSTANNANSNATKALNKTLGIYDFYDITHNYNTNISGGSITDSRFNDYKFLLIICRVSTTFGDDKYSRLIPNRDIQTIFIDGVDRTQNNSIVRRGFSLNGSVLRYTGGLRNNNPDNVMIIDRIFGLK